MDRYTSTDLGPLYIGKDLSSLEMFYRLFEIPKEDRLLVLQIVQHLDAKVTKQALDNIKKKSKELARKTKTR